MMNRKILFSTAMLAVSCAYVACAPIKNGPASPPSQAAVPSADVARAAKQSATQGAAIQEFDIGTASEYTKLFVQATINGDLLPVYVVKKCNVAGDICGSSPVYMKINCASGKCNDADTTSPANITFQAADKGGGGILMISDSSSMPLDNCSYLEITGYKDAKLDSPTDAKDTPSSASAACGPAPSPSVSPSPSASPAAAASLAALVATTPDLVAGEANPTAKAAVQELDIVPNTSNLEVNAVLNGALMPMYVIQKCYVGDAGCQEYFSIQCDNDKQSCTSSNSDVGLGVLVGSSNTSLQISVANTQPLDGCSYLQIIGYADDKYNGATAPKITGNLSSTSCQAPTK